MTTHEWIMLIIVLLGGFWTLNRQLAKIEIALSGKVSYRDCSDRQDKCPCHFRVLYDRMCMLTRLSMGSPYVS